MRVLCQIYLVMTFLLVGSALADTYFYDDSGRLQTAEQSNGLSHAYGLDAEANIDSAASSGVDSEPNGISDWWENFYFATTGINALSSAAGDGVSNLTKYAVGLNPLSAISGPLVGISQEEHSDGQIYNFFTFTRAKGTAPAVFLEQSSNGTTWTGGGGFFVQVGQAEDLGNGTERVTFRNLTPIPAANGLSFRLVTDGGSPSLVAYNNLSSGTGVPSMPWWAFVALIAALPLLASRFLKISGRNLARTVALLCFGFAAIVPARADSASGWGWELSDYGDASPTASNAEPLFSPAQIFLEPEFQQQSVVDGPIATAVTHEIQAIAVGLQNDPVAISNYVRNKIAFQPYLGSCKGAHTTLLDSAGNDFDQASLLISLLNAAGYGNTSYVFGRIKVLNTSPDSQDLSHLFGCPANQVSRVLFAAGYTNLLGTNQAGGSVQWRFDSVWVRVEIGGATYDLNPSLKFTNFSNAIDVKTISGYSRTQLLTDAGGTTGTHFVQNVARSSLESRLATYASNLRNHIRTNLPNSTTEDILGGNSILEEGFTDLASAASSFLPFIDTDPNFSQTTSTTIPTIYRAAVGVKVGSQIDATFYADGMQSQRLSLRFQGSNAQVWLGESMKASETNGNGTNASVTLSLTNPRASLSRTLPATNYRRDSTYDLSYAFYPNPFSSGQIEASDRRVQNYVHSGLADTSPNLLSESLHNLGVRWIRRVALGTWITGRTSNFFTRIVQVLGRTGQEGAYFVDMPGVIITQFNENGGDPKVFNAAMFILSAMEHGVIEQTGGSAASSTIKCLALGNDGGQRIYRVDSSTYPSISSQLINYNQNNNERKNFLESFINLADCTVLLHQNGATQLNQWNGFGFAAIRPTRVDMMIWGGYSGGFHSFLGLFGGSFLDILLGRSPEDSIYPFGVMRARSLEPVDLATGAYTMEANDLSLGEANTPRGLVLSRSYDSGRIFQKSALGNGWRHSCDGKVFLASDLDSAFGFRQPTDAVQTIVAALAIPDFTDASLPAKDLLVGALTANWLVNRITNNSAVVQMGEQRLTYLSQPDGSWNPPPGCTTNLSGASGSFSLLPRFGGSVLFDAQNRVSQWKDVDNNTQTYLYDALGRLSTVTDSQNRTLTFNYLSASSPLIDNVTDGTGRTVKYFYTGNNLTGIRDVENFNTTLVYDSRNRLTEWKDHAGDFLVRNFYDTQDRVYEQYSQGDANRLWKFLYAPGSTLEVDPFNNATTHLFDTLKRRTAIIDPLGNRSGFEYSGQNHVTEATDGSGRSTSFFYDSNQNLRTKTDNAGKITLFDYDTSLRLWKITDATNRVTEFTYDSENHLKTIKDPGLRVTTYDYRPDGRLEKITDNDGKTTQFTAYDQWANPTTIIRADNTTTSAVFNARGDRTSYTNGRGHTTGFTYDKRRLLKTRTDALLKTTTWNYDSNGHLDNVIDRNNKTTETLFDNFGKIQTLTAPDTGTLNFGYDFRDLQTTITDGLTHTTTTGYDDARRPESITDALDLIISRTTYDGANRPLTEKNALDQTTRVFYDPVGRFDYSLDPLNRRIDKTYDDAGREKTLKNRRGKTFIYDHAPDGLASTFSYPSGRQSAILDRDPVGRPKTLQEPSGQQTVLHHDAMGRLKTQTDQVGHIVWDYDDEGNPEFVTEGSAIIGRTFDELNRVETCTDTLNKTVGYTYDNEGNIETITYPGNKTVTYTYDGSNRLKTVTDWAQRLTSYFYDDAGRLRRIERPNGTQQRIEYDDANRLQDTFEELGSTSLWKANYLFDDAYRLQTYTPTPPTRTYAPPPASMTYDDDNRLETYNGQTVPSDLDGNLRAAPLNGTLLGTLNWDARNRLTSAESEINNQQSIISYSYDAENRRVTSTSPAGTTRYTWSREAPLDRLLVKENPDGSVTRYIHGLGLIYEETEPAGGGPVSTQYYHYNWQGSTMALSDQAGAITARLSYSPYGEVTVVSGTPNTPFLFNGQFGVMTEQNGLYCLQARFYSPIFRRFLSEDPAGFSGGINLFAYTGGDPVNFMDPFGLGRTNSNWFLQGIAQIFSGISSWEQSLFINRLNTEAQTAQAYRDHPNMAAIGDLSSLDYALTGMLVVGPQIIAIRQAAAEAAALAATRTGVGAADDAAMWIWGHNKGVAKSIRQMDQRGWFPRQVTEAVRTGQQFPATNLVNKGNPAIRYVHPQTGQSIVQDTITREIIHFGGPGFKY